MTTNLCALAPDQFQSLLDKGRHETVNATAQILQDNRAQAPQALAAARTDDQRGIRAPELDVVDFPKWRTCGERFITTVKINGWIHAQARQEMSVCISGEARDVSAGIDLVPADAIHRGMDYKLVLQEIEALIIPALDSDMTWAQLVSAKQEPNEDILKWHSQIRVLWMRAHPKPNRCRRE